MTDAERKALGARLGRAQARYQAAMRTRGNGEAAVRERADARAELELCEELAQEALQANG